MRFPEASPILPPTRTPSRPGPRLALGLTGLLFLSACIGGGGELDWDLRSGNNVPNTSEAARQPTANRPAADARGVLTYPGYQMAEAERGDTVASVAARLALDPAALANANALRPGDPLREGELLLLPNRVAGVGAVIGAPGATVGGSGVDVGSIATTALDRVEPGAGAAPAVAPASGPEPQRHRVARGETAFTIARAYNVPAKALADWNGLGADLAVREGQTLIIPVVTGPAPVVEDSAAPGAGSPTPEPAIAAEPLPDEDPTPQTEPARETPASPDLGETRSETTAALAMPVAGKIIRPYKKNEGIDISAAPGAAVKAADAGTVAAVTKDTGQVAVVVIRHANGLLTVYAGLDGVSVAKGDTVARGQQIATVRAGSPSFLRFEVRKGAASVDPVPYLQ